MTAATTRHWACVKAPNTAQRSVCTLVKTLKMAHALAKKADQPSHSLRGAATCFLCDHSQGPHEGLRKVSRGQGRAPASASSCLQLSLCHPSPAHTWRGFLPPWVLSVGLLLLRRPASQAHEPACLDSVPSSLSSAMWFNTGCSSASSSQQSPCPLLSSLFYATRTLS